MMKTDWEKLRAKSCRIWNKQKKDICTGFDGTSIMGYRTGKEARRAMFRALKVEILDALDYEKTYAVMRFNVDSAIVGLQCGWIPCADLKLLSTKQMLWVHRLSGRRVRMRRTRSSPSSVDPK